MEEGSAAGEEQIVWIVEESVVSAEDGSKPEKPADAPPPATTVSFEPVEPVTMPNVETPSGSELKPDPAPPVQEQKEEEIVWIVDDAVTSGGSEEGKRGIEPAVERVSEPSFSKTEETEEIKHPADVPIKNGICATPPKENGVHPPKSETQEETLDGRDEDKSKRRKSVQFVFNERDQAAKKPLEDRPARTGKPAPSILHISPQRIDSLRTCDSELKEPTGAIFLPDHTVIVTDNQIGLILLSMSLDPICKSNDSQSQWKSAQSPVYVRDRGSVLVSLLYKEKDSVDYQRHLAEFDINFLAIKKRIVGPKWIIDYPNTRDRLSVAANGYVYLSVADAAFSGVYELAPNGTWTELLHRYDLSFIDVQVLAIVGPITQLLVVEEKRGYIWHLSVRESRVVDRKLLAVVERPGALAVDQRGNFFVYDKILGKIVRIDTGDPLYRHLEDVALVQHPACHVAANFGILTVVEKLGKTVHLHRYWSMK